MKTEVIAGFAHCVHHDKHFEFCFGFDERVVYIKANKPKESRSYD